MEGIPEREEPEIYREAAFIEEELTLVRSGEGIIVCMQYPLLGMRTAVEQCCLRKTVCEKLREAARNLPSGWRLKVWDAWRPFALQEELFRVYREQIVREFHLEEKSEAEKEAVLRKFVSLPVADSVCPPVHTTGGAVDVTLVDAAGNELWMGTGFDAFSEKTYTAYYEQPGKDKQVRENRRILYHAMTKAGFVNLPSEWWHFDYGDRFWAYYRREPAKYEGIFTLPGQAVQASRSL